jgi:hypothetical protein
MACPQSNTAPIALPALRASGTAMRMPVRQTQEQRQEQAQNQADLRERQLLFIDQAEHQRNQEDHDEEPEQDFGDFGGAGCDAAKPEDAGDDGDHQKNDGIAQHKSLLWMGRLDDHVA